MEKIKNKRVSLLYPVLTAIGFQLLWLVYVVLNRTYHFGNIWSDFFGYGDIIWMTSGLCLVLLGGSYLSIPVKGMLTTRPKARVLFLLLSIVALYYLVSMFVIHGGFYTNPEESLWRLAITFAIVAVQEELFYRGWLQNSLQKALSPPSANLLSSLFFLLIHYPGWILSGTPFPTLLTLSAGIYVLSLFFGWSFRKTGSIWTPIFLHMVWDICSRLFF